MALRHAFTVIEMLVVIAIIAILAAILFPVLSAAKARAQRAVCMNHLRQIGLDIHLYAGDSGDAAPKTAWTSKSHSMYLDGNTAFKRLLDTQTTSNLFICPADTFYFNYSTKGVVCVPQGLYRQASSEFSSYGFNGGQLTIFGTNTPGIAGQKLSSIRNPARTVLVAEMSAYFPWSWHKPMGNIPFINDANNMVCFVDGHVSYIKMFWNTSTPSEFALEYNPPGGYEYQWTGD